MYKAEHLDLVYCQIFKLEGIFYLIDLIPDILIQPLLRVRKPTFIFSKMYISHVKLGIALFLRTSLTAKMRYR